MQNKGMLDSVNVSVGFLPKGTIKLWFDSVWMGVTGGAMVGATSGGGGGGGGGGYENT